jgi:hypothetical protein
MSRNLFITQNNESAHVVVNTSFTHRSSSTSTINSASGVVANYTKLCIGSQDDEKQAV